MTVMFDSASEQWPADATEILVPTDGAYAHTAADARRLFPNATFQTYSCAGQTVAEWIDVEPGCVWPISAAVTLWAKWRTEGCKGFYMALTNQAAIQQAVAAANLGAPEPLYFDANWTGHAHIDPGDYETQFEGNPTGGYDETEVPDPPPQPPPVKETDMPAKLVVAQEDATGNYGPITALQQFVISPAGKFEVFAPDNSFWVQLLGMEPEPVSGKVLADTPTIT